MLYFFTFRRGKYQYNDKPFDQRNFYDMLVFVLVKHKT